jgi:opacity protein-like surface antigen
MLLLLAVGAGRVAAAKDPSAEEKATAEVVAEAEAQSSFQQGPFAFVVDPSTPARGTLALAYTLGMGSGVSADRPIPVVLQAAGVSNRFTLGYGLTSWLEPIAEVTVTSSSGSTVASALAGVKLQLTAPRSPWRAAVLAGALREGASGAGGIWIRAAGSWTAGPFLAELNGYGERVIATGRDPLDYAVMAGLSWRLLDWVRAGAEYVGQDLEELGGDGAEGGARQAVGPTLAFDLDGGHYQLVGSALLGVGARSPTSVVRIGLLASF